MTVCAGYAAGGPSASCAAAVDAAVAAASMLAVMMMQVLEMLQAICTMPAQVCTAMTARAPDTLTGPVAQQQRVCTPVLDAATS